ncbi:MAG: outer membrane lipoprotein LolB [Burkholderiales bacterium]|nr:MAG: outer membrane lipoprotein LolB [Burkholderiales bacterium]
MALVLAGCAAPARLPPADGAGWHGRLALQVDSDPPQAYSGGFELRGSPVAGELQLSSPLGQTLAQVRWDPSGAELRQGQRLTRRGSLEDLTQDLSGTALPVAAMFDWLAGRDTRADGWEADLSRHAEGRITARRIQPPPSAQLRLIFLP